MATYMLLLYAEDADEETRAARRAELPEWEALRLLAVDRMANGAVALRYAPR